jgi:hypothetical protein
MSNLSIANVINISVSQTGAGLGVFNTSNLALISHEAKQVSFGALGYKLYKEPSEVSTDFGSDSITYKMALAVFSQQPNILANGGYLAILAALTSVQNIAFSLVATAGAFVVTFGGANSASIAWNDTAAVIQTKLRAVSGLSSCVVTGSISAGLSIALNAYGPKTAITVTSNTLLATSTPVVATVAQAVVGEKFSQTITRLDGVIQFFGVIETAIMAEVDLLEFAAVVQPLIKIAFAVSNDDADVAVSGKLDKLRSGSFSRTRGLYYGSTELEALIMMASYAGRGLSTIFSGSNTTQDMHLKELIGVQPDPSMDQTTLVLCKSAGVDIYASIEGLPKVYCSGANTFFDRVYNLLWFVSSLQIAGFNALAQNSTKISQTENGAKVLTSAYRLVCEAGITNEFLAPGEWTNPTTFGRQADLYENISQRGYYIYSQPVSQQSAVDRAARQAPVVQIAIKEAGSINSASVIINVNA